MQSSIITDVFLPLALGIIMLGMGLTLVPADFSRILKYPKAVAIGLSNQIILLPVIGFLLLSVFNLTPELAVGLIILAACPGGATSNLLCHLAKGDVALSVTLTAFATIITMFTIPLLVNYGIALYMPGEAPVVLPLQNTILKLFIMAVLPVILGMTIKRFAGNFADKAEKPVRIMSAVFLVMIIFGAILKDRANLVPYLLLAGPATLSLNVLTLLAGYFTAKISNLSHRQSLTIAIESGIQNGTLAITIALSMLNNSGMAIPPAIYSLIMFFTAGVVITLALRNKEVKVVGQKL